LGFLGELEDNILLVECVNVDYARNMMLRGKNGEESVKGFFRSNQSLLRRELTEMVFIGTGKNRKSLIGFREQK
jgi:hypothetical protein